MINQDSINKLLDKIEYLEAKVQELEKFIKDHISQYGAHTANEARKLLTNKEDE